MDVYNRDYSGCRSVLNVKTASDSSLCLPFYLKRSKVGDCSVYSDITLKSELITIMVVLATTPTRWHNRKNGLFIETRMDMRRLTRIRDNKCRSNFRQGDSVENQLSLDLAISY